MVETTVQRCDRWPNLTRMFFDRAAERGDAPFLWRKRAGAWRSTSWAEAARIVAGLADALRALDRDEVLREAGEAVDLETYSRV